MNLIGAPHRESSRVSSVVLMSATHFVHVHDNHYLRERMNDVPVRYLEADLGLLQERGFTTDLDMTLVDTVALKDHTKPTEYGLRSRACTRLQDVSGSEEAHARRVFTLRQHPGCVSVHASGLSTRHGRRGHRTERILSYQGSSFHRGGIQFGLSSDVGAYDRHGHHASLHAHGERPHHVRRTTDADARRRT